MTTLPNRYGCSADTLICSIEAADHCANVALVHRGRFELAMLQLLTAGAVLVARWLERANR